MYVVVLLLLRMSGEILDQHDMKTTTCRARLRTRPGAGPSEAVDLVNPSVQTSLSPVSRSLVRNER